MNALDIDLKKRYSYADYLGWVDDIRRELHNGLVKLLAPAPSRKHQEISFNISGILRNYLLSKRCKAYHAPSDVRLPKTKKSPKDKDIYTVVQPDIYIVCDLKKLDDRGCLGAPDMIIEIVSAHDPKRDIREKYDIYEEHGVREYWIVNPNDQNVSVFLLDEHGKYQLVSMYAGDDKIPVNIFNGDLKIDLTEVFMD